MLNTIFKGISSTNGRLNRLGFLVIFIICVISYIIIEYFGPMIFDKTLPQYDNYLYFLKIPFIAFSLIATVNRFHDMGKSGWFFLLQLIPLVNLGIIVWLLVGEGTKGKNDYGDNPLDNLKIS